MSFEYFSPIYGLVTQSDPITENGGLFLAHYISDLKEKEQKALDIYLSKMDNAKLSNGLYMRSANHTKRSVSHDEISGMMIASSYYNTYHRFEIWKKLISNLGAYPVVIEGFSDRLPYNPGNYYAWGAVSRF